jgi:hypothetical protein
LQHFVFSFVSFSHSKKGDEQCEGNLITFGRGGWSLAWASDQAGWLGSAQLRSPLQDLIVLLTEFFYWCKTHISSVINLPMKSPTKILRSLLIVVAIKTTLYHPSQLHE